MLEFNLDSLQLFAQGLRFPEGPVALADGTLLCTEIEGDSVARIAADGTILRRYPCAAGPNGMAIGPDGAAYVVSDGGLTFAETDGVRGPVGIPDPFVGGAIQRLDLNTGAIETLYDEVDGVHIGVLNDVVFDTEGKAYVVETVYGKLYYFDPAGGMIRTAIDGLEAPNGMGISPDGSTIFVSETYSGNIWRIPIEAPGQPGEKVLHWSNKRAHGFDGLSIDGQGNICAASLGPSGITVISPEGEKVGFVPLPLDDSFVTNIVFAGDDLCDAYICSAGRGRMYKMRWPHPGLRLNFNA